MEKMKTSLLLLFAIFLMIMMGTEKIFAREQSASSELSNALSSRSTDRTDREKKINKGFEWIIQGVHILGQMDDFISDRTKNIIRKLHTVYNENQR